MEEVVLPSIRVGHSGGGAFESLASDEVEKKKLTLGVCVMEKKSRSSPMTAILDRLRMFGEVEVIIFEDRMILHDPIEKWPICDALIAFYSTGFPLAKAQQYAALRKPYLVNELEPQWLLHDRRKVYAKLEEHGLMMPTYAIVNREGEGEGAEEKFEEEEDYVVIAGKRINKPFVEKPVDGGWWVRGMWACECCFTKEEDYVAIAGKRINKPFVEKPVDGGEGAEEKEEDCVVIVGKRINKPFVEKPVDGGWVHAWVVDSWAVGLWAVCAWAVMVGSKVAGCMGLRSVRVRWPARLSSLPSASISSPTPPLFLLSHPQFPTSPPVFPCPLCFISLPPGDDHSVMIYYPSSAGGGMKELFRKVGNRSSEFHPDVRHVRRHGSYIYEEFLPTGGTDVKVYTVGPDYAHAEARKSPVVDGVVMRSADGKEIRYPVLLTPTEKEMARVICLAFGQAVCGFDLLRSHGRSFVCDVNGWSFVKNSTKYYDDAACVLRSMLLRAVAPHLYSPLPVRLPWSSGPDATAAAAAGVALDGTTSPDYERSLTNASSFNSVHTFGTREELRCVIAVIRQTVSGPDAAAVAAAAAGGVALDGTTSPDYERTLSASSFNSAHTFGTREELRCVIAVIRHHEVKFAQNEVAFESIHKTQDQLLKLMLKHNGGKPRSEAKLKSAVQLQDLLDALRALVPHQRDGSDSETEDFENAEKLRHVKAVLEEGGHFSGIYRKAQLKPQKWERVQRRDSSGAEVEVDEPTEALMVLKYGGVLTHAGRAQAEHLGRAFREAMYPDEMGSNGTGLLRLHSTYRHDLKIYSSDEGRVQVGSGQWGQGSLVSKDSPMLDGLDSASIEMEHAKRKLGEMMTTNDPPVLSPTHGQPNVAHSPRRPSQSRSHSRSSSTSSSHGGFSGHTAGPWMTHAPWLPDRPLSKLHKLVELIKALAAHAKEKCREDDVDGALEAKVEEAVKKLRIVPVPAQHKAEVGEQQQQQGVGEQQGGAQQQGGGKHKAVPYDGTVLGKARFDESRIKAGLPCGTEEFLLIFARWKKLERDIYNPRKDRFNISKIPDVYDSAKYDLVHNRHLGLRGLDELYLLAKEMADGVIPNEYGITPYSKLKIGAKVARRLLGKMLIDLHNTRDEAVAVGQAMQQHRQSLREQRAAAVAAAVFNQEQQRQHRRSSGEAKRRSDGHPEGDNDDSNAQYRLDPKYANVRTPQRHVRTRLYFTSESHLHSVMNVLRFCQLDDSLQGEAPLLSPDAMTRLYETRELDYLTHVVLRMYENVEVDLNDPRRFRVEIMFSPGSAVSPLEVEPSKKDHTLPVLPPFTVQNDAPDTLTMRRMDRMLHPFAMPPEDFPPPVQPQGFSGLFLKGTVFERITHHLVRRAAPTLSLSLSHFLVPPHLRLLMALAARLLSPSSLACPARALATTARLPRSCLPHFILPQSHLPHTARPRSTPAACPAAARGEKRRGVATMATPPSNAEMAGSSEEAPLASRRCVPCEGKGLLPLPADRIANLLDQVAGWEVVEEGGYQRIRRQWRTRNFLAGLTLFQRVAEVAEAEGHHPDLHLEGWNHARIDIYTHAIGGLHENDFVLAAKINALHLEDLLRKPKTKIAG
ncbi:unnamed protein product [Closterium sp. Yama58-4]|nr:unnamed protein product [Closterium sp. Yama58-4]